jgi:hypothetical protein
MAEMHVLTSPSISVLMPARDAGKTIRHAVNDLLRGMAQDDELLVVDDGSLDRTPDVLRAIASSDHRLRIVTTSGVGLVEALNLGLDEVRHDWVARADADDRYPPGRLSLQRAAITTDVVLVSGDYRATAGARDLGVIPTALSEPFVKLSLVNPQRIPHPGVLVHRQAVLAAGGYRQEDFPAEDLGLWSRLRSEGSFVGVPGLVVEWHMRRGSITHSRQREQREATRRIVKGVRISMGGVNAEDMAAELSRYDNDPLGVTRAMLLARDLRSTGRLDLLSPASVELARFLGKHPLDVPLSVGRLIRDRRARDRMRSA